jgi:hypothetical protein
MLSFRSRHPCLPVYLPQAWQAGGGREIFMHLFDIVLDYLFKAW